MRMSTDPKENTIKLRINDDMRNYIEKSSKRKGNSISEYVRELIEKDMRSKQC